MNRFFGGCLGVFLSLLLAVSLLLNLVLVGCWSLRGAKIDADAPETLAEHAVGGESASANKIVVLLLHGVIGGGTSGEFGENLLDDLNIELRQAQRDPAVKGIILRIDSPGGEVTASDEIYHRLAEFRREKPITVYMESVAASGGYYSALGSNWIVANELSLTGSIGVILETFNVAGLLDKIGVKALTIKSGKMKDLLSPFRASTPEEVAYIQTLIDETYSRFVGLVAKERKLDEQALRSGIADGRVLSGRQAKEAGLVDQLGYFEDAVKKEKELCKIPDAKLVRYQASFRWDRLFKTLAATQVGSLKVELPGGALPLRSGRLYYLPASAVGY
jgi:protease-4